MNKLALLLVVALLASCVRHVEMVAAYKPITSFSGRLLVFDQKHRFQVELDWLANEEKGMLRLTHALSGRVVFVRWQGQDMYWRDNDKMLNWQGMSVAQLHDMGVLLPPWTLAHIFLGKYPDTMQSKDERMWKGTWDGYKLQVKWGSDYKRVEITDFKRGRKAIVIIHDE
ncbi:MAG: hypothetical protein Q9N67_08950 [Ghiorsea sp.]|nr:hypothetical protein [Ghiorsea sp.]